MAPRPATTQPGQALWLTYMFAGSFGAFLGMTLLKFGNPPIMEKYVSTPGDIFELVLGYPWPISWAYWMLFLVAALGLLVARPNRGAPKWLAALPLAWFVWQALAGAQSVDTQLSMVTLKHFIACIVCFYLGFFSLGALEDPWPLWVGLFLGFILVVWSGFQQHFGGLEETRRYFFTYVYPKMETVPPEYLEKMKKDRIFGTMFYPNALAGMLLLLTPPVLAQTLRCQRLTWHARRFLALVICLASVACLFWSGSKGGWLLALLLGVIALLRLPGARAIKTLAVVCVVILGLAGFFWKYASFFKRGATSVSARMDYWQAAAKTAASNPIFGTGPGTFAIPYAKLKRPESEMSRMVHNDYLEQASDSGLIGFLTYGVFIVGALALTLRGLPPAKGLKQSLLSSTEPPVQAGSLKFWVWLGVLGWSLQGFLEFGLYLPALAWTAFALLGWLVGSMPKA